MGVSVSRSDERINLSLSMWWKEMSRESPDGEVKIRSGEAQPASPDLAHYTVGVQTRPPPRSGQTSSMSMRCGGSFWWKEGVNIGLGETHFGGGRKHRGRESVHSRSVNSRKSMGITNNKTNLLASEEINVILLLVYIFCTFFV